MNKYEGYLAEDDVILDVAGGKGDLSWLLRNINGIDSVVLDPRITKNHIVKSVKYLREHADEARKRAIPNQPTHQPLAALMPKLGHEVALKSPRHIQMLVDTELVEALKRHKEANQESSWEKFWINASIKAQERHTLGCQELEGFANNQILDAAEALKTIVSAKLIVGFHPDQATDPCLELAEELGIPVCVVPCCVFPKQFPNRILADGTKVKQYLQLIEYLESRLPCVQKEALDFDFTNTARNIALFTLP